MKNAVGTTVIELGRRITGTGDGPVHIATAVIDTSAAFTPTVKSTP